jgi:hypothetical protein
VKRLFCFSVLFFPLLFLQQKPWLFGLTLIFLCRKEAKEGPGSHAENVKNNKQQRRPPPLQSAHISPE